MRFNDVQDTRKAETMKAKKNESFGKIYVECLDKVSSMGRKNMVSAFGATFTI